MIDPGESGDLRGEREGLGGAARGIGELVRVPIAETPERRRDRARIARAPDRPALTVHDRLGTAGRGARDDRDPRCDGFEVDVAERLVAARQDDDVSGGIPALDVAPRTEPRDPGVHCEAGRPLPERRRGAPADDDEATRAVCGDGERVDHGVKALALEAAPDEEQGPRVGDHPGLGAGEVPLRRAVLRVEALEVHTVVDDRETLARDAVEVGDLRRAATGERDDVRSRRDHAPLELEHDAVEQRATPARIAHALEVGPVATLPRPVDVLAERALVALHDVPTAAGHDDARDSRERQGARRGRERGEREHPPCDARHPRLAIRAQEVDVVAVLYQRAHETGRRPLDAAVEDEGARAPSSLASAGCSSRRRIAAASPRGSPGATTRPQPSRISGIIETAVETIGRPRAIASKSFAGTCPTVSVVARWGTATTSAATR